MTQTVPLVLSSVALVLSLAALVLAVLVARQSSGVAGILKRHRLAHTTADGVPDPGAHPRRRAYRQDPPQGMERRRRPEERPDLPPGALRPEEEAETAEQPLAARTEAMPRVLPRPGQVGRR